MEILRQEYEINGDKLLIQLPKNFSKQTVEVIINPIHKVNKKIETEESNFSKFQKFLINGPIMTQDEENKFQNINKEFEAFRKS